MSIHKSVNTIEDIAESAGSLFCAVGLRIAAAAFNL
jgi:hypothetical protein